MRLTFFSNLSKIFIIAHGIFKFAEYNLKYKTNLEQITALETGVSYIPPEDNSTHYSEYIFNQYTLWLAFTAPTVINCLNRESGYSLMFPLYFSIAYNFARTNYLYDQKNILEKSPHNSISFYYQDKELADIAFSHHSLDAILYVAPELLLYPIITLEQYWNDDIDLINLSRLINVVAYPTVLASSFLFAVQYGLFISSEKAIQKMKAAKILEDKYNNNKLSPKLIEQIFCTYGPNKVSIKEFFKAPLNVSCTIEKCLSSQHQDIYVTGDNTSDTGEPIIV